LVAFEANRADGSQAILTGDGTHLTTVAATGGRFRDFTGNVSINNDGEVVFAADLAGGGRGIFSARGDAVHEIIGTGDSLFGSTVSSLAAVPFSPRALNNLGQVGFLANLADGTTVWVRADPLGRRPVGDGEGHEPAAGVPDDFRPASAALATSPGSPALPPAQAALPPEGVGRLDQLFAAGLGDGASLLGPRSRRGLWGLGDADATNVAL
jgi:hypothetical protein